MTKAWNVEFKPSAFKELKKLDQKIQSQVMRFLERLTASNNSPRDTGKALQGSYKGLWRYRVGDYRLICEIQDKQLVVLILAIGHRRKIYAKH